MKEKVKLYGSIFILIIFVPYLITVYLHGSNFRFAQDDSDQEQIETQLVGILAQEIPISYETECLKAQAVIARTNLYREQQEAKAAQQEAEQNASAQEGSTNSNTAQSGWSLDQMRQIWGDSYDENLEKIEQAITQTKGEIITFEGEPIQAAYHFASNMQTRNASEVPGQEDYVYLVSVPSSEDILADGFLYIGYRGKQEFADAIGELFEGETIVTEELPQSLEITERDSAGYVTKVTYGNTVVNGEALREVLGLNSACFYFSELDGNIRIVTKGIGHGLGFSQYGANELAKSGYSYKELLSYYYEGVEIKQR
jgi:stage II sporulation protein D